MFQSISFTFLCALALMSWSMLCYLDAGNDKKGSSQDYKVEVYTEHSRTKDDFKFCQHKPSENNFSNRAFNIIFNYGLVLLTTGFLLKLLQWTEQRVHSYLLTKHSTLIFTDTFPFIQIVQNVPELAEKPEEKPPFLEKENVELKEQLNDLQTRVRELLKELRAINSKSMATDLTCIPSNSSFSGSEDESFHSTDEASGTVLAMSSGLSIAQSNDQQSTTSLTQNVYITHSHYHFNFNGSVNVKDQNINVGALRAKNLHRRSEFLQVWGTFINGPLEQPMLKAINNIFM